VIATASTRAVHGSLVGPLRRCETGRLVLGPSMAQSESTAIPTVMVQRLWVRDNSRRLGLLVGAPVGAVIGGGLALVKTCTSSSMHCRGNVALDALLGGVVGGVFGWAFGHGLPGWKNIYTTATWIEPERVMQPGSSWAQEPHGAILRLEEGSLTSGDVLQPNFAAGASIGWWTSDRRAILFRYFRQAPQENGTRLGRHAGQYLTANYEYVFGRAGQYRRQALFRIGAGARVQSPLGTALTFGPALELRYAVARRWAFLGVVEDDATAIPRWLHHNVGFIIMGEWRPGQR
jgi:hypothetical protein